MFLVRVRLMDFGPFDTAELEFGEEGEPRLMTVIHGGGGVGKTTLLSAVAATRPGHVIASSSAGGDREVAGQVVAEYRLGQDDPDRPHTLVLASPNARVFPDEATENLRRREQALFDRVAREGGFVFLSIPAHRWFSRQPVALLGPARSVARYDVRGAIGFDDPTRADLTRETKQALAYADIAAALAPKDAARNRFLALREAMHWAVGHLVQLSGHSYEGVDPLSLEPMFSTQGRSQFAFDQLPTQCRHLVAFAALAVRVLWAGHPERDPREAEGVVAIDDVDLHQDTTIQGGLVAALKLALPRVQWLLTTSSAALAASCDAREVFALRWNAEQARVQCFSGLAARTH